MVKHKNESRFEFALRLTKALKAQEQFIWVDDMDSNRQYLDAKQILDVLYDEIMNPVDPLADEITLPFKSYAMEAEFNEFSPSVMEEAAPKVDHSFVDTLKEKLAPTVIHTEEENERYTAMLYELSQNYGDLSADERKLADLLALLIEDFEEKNYPFPDVDPMEEADPDKVDSGYAQQWAEECGHDR